MYAVFIEVNADASVIDKAREGLPREAAPQVREMGAKAGYWLAPNDGRGVAVLVFETEAEARDVAGHFKVGESAGSPVPEVTFRTVEVREVLASV
jgi:hypothetical protein